MSAIPSRTCRGCGCINGRACPEGCEWVLLDIEAPTGLCSACAEDLEWDSRFMILRFPFEEIADPMAHAAATDDAEEPWAPRQTRHPSFFGGLSRP